MVRRTKEEALRQLQAIGIDNLVDDNIKPREPPDSSNPNVKLKVFQKPTPIMPLESWDKALIVALDKMVRVLDDHANVKRQLGVVVHTRHHSHHSHKKVAELTAADVSRFLRNCQAHIDRLARERVEDVAPLRKNHLSNNAKETEAKEDEKLVEGDGQDDPVTLEESYNTHKDDFDTNGAHNMPNIRPEEYNGCGNEVIIDMEEEFHPESYHNREHEYTTGTLDEPDSLHECFVDVETEWFSEFEADMHAESDGCLEDEEEEGVVEDSGPRGDIIDNQVDDHNTADIQEAQNMPDFESSCHEDALISMDSQDKPGVQAVVTVFLRDPPPEPEEPRIDFADVCNFIQGEGWQWPGARTFCHGVTETRVDLASISVPTEDVAAAEAAFKDTSRLVHKIRRLSKFGPVLEEHGVPRRKISEANLKAAMSVAQDTMCQDMDDASRQRGNKAAHEKAEESILCHDRAEFEWCYHMDARLAQIDYNNANAEHGLVLSPKMKELYESVIL
ncbi:uncharacterized protein IWZ02DRAFT_491742 [Phyllosticta citriasiana]|uniref:uncharacterized protein n=1 Tax=Phyllosticta citriasiana TaxID=595635 RepID=UPI0030FD5019